MTRLFIGIGLALAALATCPAWGQAQPYPYNPYYYNPYAAGRGRGYNAGAYLQGSAQVMQAYGDVVNSQENARILREKANQEKLNTRKQAFEQMMYEKANTPTYGQELARDKTNILTRLMDFPVRSEITDGKTLNTMLPFLQTLANQGTMGPPVPLAQSMVNLLNISGSGASSVGILRDGGRVDWPLGLQGKNQQALDKLLPEAYKAAAAGKLTPTLMKQVRTELTAMRETLRTQCAKDEIDTSTYLPAVEFYNSLKDSVNALERPDAKKQLAGVYAPRARNVQELVDYMTDNGLQFAPASPGNENAYQVAHDAFVRYARAAQGSSGFQAINAPAK